MRACDGHGALPVVLISAAPLDRPEDCPDGLDFDEVALKPLSATALTEILQRHLGLVWECAAPEMDSPAPGPEEDTPLPDLSLLPGCCDLQRGQLRAMLDLAAVVASERWATEMAAVHPAHRSLCDEISRRAAAVDLAGLRTLMAQLQAEPAGERARQEAVS